MGIPECAGTLLPWRLNMTSCSTPTAVGLAEQSFIVLSWTTFAITKCCFPIVTIIIHGDFYHQDAQVERYPENNPYRRVLEGIGIRQYEQLHPLSFKTVRKFFGEAVVVTQEVEDIILLRLSRVPSLIIVNCKILL